MAKTPSKNTPIKNAAAVPKKAAAAAVAAGGGAAGGVVDGKEKKKNKRRSRIGGKSTKPNFGTYIYRVLKETHPTIGITKKSMGIMNDFVIDMMDRLASEAKSDLTLSSKNGAEGKGTLKEWHFNTATKLVLPGELKKHGVTEGTKAVRNFNAAREAQKKKDASGKK